MDKVNIAMGGAAISIKRFSLPAICLRRDGGGGFDSL
jgi:hypothetical protein